MFILKLRLSVQLEMELAVTFEKLNHHFTHFHGSRCFLILDVTFMGVSKHTVAVVFLGHDLEIFHAIV